MLRYIADLKTLLWMSITVVVLVVLWNAEGFIWWLYVPYLYLSVCFSVFAHNHNHLPMWKSKILNFITDIWITLFYGFPVFAWIPTHNKNHHLHNNKEPDYTKTYMASEKNNLWTLLIYPTLSGAAQQKAVFTFYKSFWSKNRTRFFKYTFQIVSLLSWVIAAFILDWEKALIYVLIPQQISLNTVLVFNYVQHIHADEESEWNHSRNIVGWALNFFLFNNGLHTAHHMQAGLHWSKLGEAHAKIEHHISPELKEKSFFGYLFRVYILGLFSKKFRTRNMRAARMERVTS